MRARRTSGPVIAGGDTKEAIREAAIRLFSVKGFEQTSLREVADAVGITKASLYYHFASKKDLLLAILEPVFDDLTGVVIGLDRVTYGPEGIREVLGRQLHALLRHRTAGGICVRDAVAIFNTVGDRYSAIIDTHRELSAWLAGPDPTPERSLRAGAALEVLGTALWSKELSPDLDDELVERVLLDAALGVLGVGAGSVGTHRRGTGRRVDTSPGVVIGGGTVAAGADAAELQVAADRAGSGRAHQR